MPTVGVSRDALFAHLGRTYTDEEFDELAFEFGVELDEITSERKEATKSATVKLSKEQIAALSDEVIYKIDVPANRYDLLCIEGISRSLKVFLGDMDAPQYKVLASGAETMTVLKTHTDTVRPYVVCAILRDVTFDEARYQSFIELQDQLHRNLCRQRTLVAIGTHDLDAVKGPFTYDARAPGNIKFVPLTHTDEGREFDGAELMRHYETDAGCKHLKPYVPIIKESPLYPVVLDSEGTVLSLPPIINGSQSRITLNTKNVFIECTATDLTKANIVLDTVVAMFSEYAAVPFSVEPVIVNYVNEAEVIVDSYQTPQMYTRKETASVKLVNSLIGIDVDPEPMATLCNKIQLGPAQILPAKNEKDGPLLEVTVPPTRSDILHAVDIAEDIGVAYGYNNIKKTVPQTCTVGREQPLNQLGDLLREEIGRAGYIEVLTHGLCSTKDNFTALRRPITAAVSLSNPANVEYEVVRTTLLPGLLNCLQHNKGKSFAGGFKLFEISDVVLPDDKHVVTQTIVGARNARRVCATYSGPTSGFEVIHGLVDRIMTLCEVAPTDEYVASSGDKYVQVHCKEGWRYTIRELREGTSDESGTYFPGRAAEILLTSPKTGGEEVVIGTFGILHPEVLGAFDILYPTTAVELNLDPLL